jgi:hypothetical protein
MERTAGFRSLGSARRAIDFQLWGSSSLSRVMECAGIRESTSRDQANGSTPQRLIDRANRALDVLSGPEVMST